MFVQTAKIFLCVLLLLPFGVTLAQTSVKPQIRQCTVHSVHDGDSMRVKCPGFRKTLRIRLDQIDAPEINQAYGQASRDYLRFLCPVGKPVTLHDLGPDYYQRTLGRVFCDGKDANAAMVAAGAAWVYEYYASDRQLFRLQDQARKARKGLWARPDKQVPPWEFRRRGRSK